MLINVAHLPSTLDFKLFTQLWTGSSANRSCNPQPWEQVEEQNITLSGHSASWSALFLLGKVNSHPSFSQVMGANGQRLVCAPSRSNSTVSVQPCWTKSQRILSLLMMFLRSGRAGFRSLNRTAVLQFGQDWFVSNHLEIHGEQKTWRQGNSTGFSKTPAQMEHMSSGLTSGNLSRSIPIVLGWFSTGI